MNERSLAERVAAVSALDEPIRRALFDHVSRSASPVSRDEAADALGLARSTAAFHLDRLAEEGLLSVEFRRLTGRTGPGAGRPSKLYARAAGELAVTVPERHYDFAGELLLGGIVLGNCPFHRLAQQHAETVCRVNLELLRGAAEGARDTRHTMVLDPGIGRCCVRAAPAVPTAPPAAPATGTGAVPA